jgi:hypothetical protein
MDSASPHANVHMDSLAIFFSQTGESSLSRGWRGRASMGTSDERHVLFIALPDCSGCDDSGDERHLPKNEISSKIGLVSGITGEVRTVFIDDVETRLLLIGSQNVHVMVLEAILNSRLILHFHLATLVARNFVNSFFIYPNQVSPLRMLFVR